MLLLSLLLAQAGYLQFLDRMDGLLSTLYIGGWMCTAAGLRQLRATGRGRAGAVISIVQMAGLTLAGTWSSLLILWPHAWGSSTFGQITDLAWPFSHLYMLVVGVAILLAKPWNGWRRCVALLCGLALPAALAAGWFGRTAREFTFGIYTTIGWMLLAYLVRMGQEPDPHVTGGVGRQVCGMSLAA